MLLLVSLTLVATSLWGQVGHRPFVKKYEAGIPNTSDLTSIWPNGNGWWGLFSKIDTMGPDGYYYGAEVALMDSLFEIQTRVSHGDTSKYYLNIPALFTKSIPDGNGNFWYWLTGYLPSDSTRPLYYGKMDSSGQILFEGEIPKSTIYDYFYEFLNLPSGGGVFLTTSLGRYAFITRLTWVDNLGTVTHLDSTERIASPYHHSTIYATYDSIRNLVIAPSFDYFVNGLQTYNMRPRISVFSPEGSLLLRKDLTPQLQDNAIGNLHATNDGGYVAWLLEYIYDPDSGAEDHRIGIVKLDASFDVVWKKYLFPPKKYSDAVVFYRSGKGDFYLTGQHDRAPNDTTLQRNWFITKFSPDLDSQWTRFYNLGGDSINNMQQNPIQMHTLDNGDILVLVQNWLQSGTYCTLYKLDSLGCLIGNCAIGDTTVIPPDTTNWQAPADTLWPDPNGGLIAYPNPSTGLFSLVWNVNVGDVSTLRVCDVTGRILLTQALPRREQASTLDLRDYRAGVYLLQITTEKGRRFWTKVSILR